MIIRWIYDLGFLAFGIFSLPHFLKRLEQAEDRKRLVRERLGIFSSDSLSGWDGHRPIWIHCVSVGEAMAAERFIRLLLERKPHQRIVVTTVTPTGQRIARQWEQDRLKVFYFPFDVGFAVRNFFEKIQPAVLLLVETELWPNVITEARRRGVPIGVINGRLSERSFRGFNRFGAIFKPLLRGIDFFLVQTDEDRNRLLALGVNSDKVRVTGNMKLDAFEGNGQWEKDRRTLRPQWGFRQSDWVLIGGSTHEGEEEILLRALRELRREGFSLRLLLAPRHIERTGKIVDLVKKQGLKPALTSTSERDLSFDVLILDRLGELRRLYAAADAVFMGGSLVRHGGQNPIEPAACRRPILHGPWVFNFQDLYRRLDEEGGSVQIADEKELVFVLKRILTNDRERNQLGNRAYETLHQLQGATERNLKWIEEKL